MTMKKDTNSSLSHPKKGFINCAYNFFFLCFKLFLKLPFTKKFKQIDLTKWSKEEIISMAMNKIVSYPLWYIRNFFSIRYYGLHRIKKYNKLNFEKLSTQEVLSIAKHEGHRIEKAFYAGYMKTSKNSAYFYARKNISKAIKVLKERDNLQDRADLLWLEKIHDSFYEFDEMIAEERKSPPTFIPNKLSEYTDFAKDRRSTRTWAQPNLQEEELFNIAKNLIESAKWSPCSGNRQPWYFKILIKKEEKELLKGI